MPLFSALLNYRYSQNGMSSPERLRAWEGIKQLCGEERTSYPLTLSVDDLGEVPAHDPSVVFNPKSVCEYMHTALESLARALETAPETAVRSLPILPEEEREKVLCEWNETKAEYPREKCVHELFEEQVERTPEAVAVEFEDASLSYEELNRRANRLAHYLRGLGVGPDVRVGICVERSLEMVVGLLGILKAGGAYVPLDAGYPVERLNYMLEDSAPAVVLTQGHLRGLLSGAGEAVPVIDLADASSVERPGGDESREGRDGPHPGASAPYVIYTSAGSTGKPKGVMVEQHAE